MTRIQTYVIFDLETTGLPWQERNQTKIIELSLIAVSREDIETCDKNTIPKTTLLTFLLNPERTVHREVTKMTGLSRRKLSKSPKFCDKFEALNDFLNSQPKPVCLIAHNGNSFDYKILLAECLDIRKCLSDDILCVDSIIAFRKFCDEIKSSKNKASKKEINPSKTVPINENKDSYFTDHQYFTIAYKKDRVIKKQILNGKRRKEIPDKSKTYIETPLPLDERQIKQIRQKEVIKTRTKAILDTSVFYDYISSDETGEEEEVSNNCAITESTPIISSKQDTDLMTDDEDECNLTDDDDEWPDLKLSDNQLEHLDGLCSQTSDSFNEALAKENLSCSKKILKSIENEIDSSNDHLSLNQDKISESLEDNLEKLVYSELLLLHDLPKLPSGKPSFTLSAIYKALLKKEPETAHRATADCTMLLQCIIKVREHFLPWADENCKSLKFMTPLYRY